MSPSKKSSGTKEDVVSLGGKEQEPVKKKIFTYGRLIGCALVLSVVFFILIVGVIIGRMWIPKVENWLEDHNFVEGSFDSGSSQKESTTEIITEENWVKDVVDQVSSGVVSIAVSEASFDPSTGEVDDSTNIGTGFVIDDSGLILTNQHVVSSMNEDYIVITSDGEEYEVKEISRDDVSDLAILKVDTDDLEALTLGNSDNLEAGQYVVAIGNPFGDLPGSVTSGIISGLGRSVTAGSGFWGSTKTYEDVIQTDAAVNPGNSGGPLLDSRGNVIGVNFATTSGADNISFALPINRAKEKISEYKKYGRFIKPYLGVEYQIITQTEAQYYRDVVPGALVLRVLDGSPADKAGIEKADIITEIAGDEVTTSFSDLIQKHKVGDEITVTVWRDGKTIEMEVTLEESK
ncbi:trypsin-like peptidase domain-containing protein [Candidatus Dojkabacteria bacterium]|nr:trypsin-like peptidase domain-containing protein [Candidatus Dojkabacteria bacterium]